MLSMAAKLAKAVGAVSSSFSSGGAGEQAPSHEDTAEADEDSNPPKEEGGNNQKDYDPHVPGSVLFMHRQALHSARCHAFAHAPCIFEGRPARTHNQMSASVLHEGPAFEAARQTIRASFELSAPVSHAWADRQPA